MSLATVLPNSSQLAFFQFSRKGSPAPKLASPISSTDTTIVFSVPLLDENSIVLTAGFLLGIRKSNGWTETIYCPAGSLGADGLTVTGAVRGINPGGYDYITGHTTFADSHDSDEPIFLNIPACVPELLRSVLQGLIASGGTSFIIGSDASGTMTIKRSTGVGTSVGMFRWSSVNSKAEYSNNGTVWVAIDDTVASVLAKVSSNDTTPGYLNGKLVAGDGIDLTENNDGGDETLGFSVDVSDLVGNGIENDGSNNFQAKLAATPGLEFSAGALQVKTKSGGGITKDADGLSSDKPTQTFTAYEAVSIDNAVALLPIEVEYFAQLTEVDLALGDANARRKYAIKIIPSATTSTLTTMQFRAKEAVNGATTLGNLTISIQTDNAGAPSGTAVTNGTANVITQVTQRTWGVSYAGRTATWAVPPTLTAGTTYWIVFEVAATDAVNYLKIGENSTYDENYLTFTRLTYDLDTTTWGGSATNATPFFWFNTQVKLLGMALCPTDANWGGRTWSFIGFAKAAIVANASGEVYYYLTPDLASLDAGSDYYLSTTAGAITVTPPGGDYANGTGPSAFTYKIGRAISSTLLLIDKGIKSQTISELGPMAATTTRQYIIWFKPRIVKIDASGVSADSFAFSSGYIREDGSDYHVRAGRCTATINDAGGDSTYSLSTAISGSANAITGAGSLLSKAGFTYTYTESGAESIWVVMEATG